MILSKKIFLLFLLVLICTTQSGCALLGLPFQLLGSAFGLAGNAASVGIAAAPYAAPFFL